MCLTCKYFVNQWCDNNSTQFLSSGKWPHPADDRFLLINQQHRTLISVSSSVYVVDVYGVGALGPCWWLVSDLDSFNCALDCVKRLSFFFLNIRFVYRSRSFCLFVNYGEKS